MCSTFRSVRLASLTVLVVVTPVVLLARPWPRSGGDGARRAAVACARLDGGFRLTDGGRGWLAGDSALSIPLSSGRSMWLFGDSLVGTADGTRRLVRNAALLHTRAGVTTLGPDDAARSFFRVPGMPEGTRWFWPGHGVAAGGRVWVVLSEMRRSGGTGVWDFRFVRNWIAEVSPLTWTVRRLTRLRAPLGIVWGAWFLRDRGRLYVWGIEDRPTAKGAVLARLSGATPRSRWEIWTGRGWSVRGRPRVLVRDVGAQLTVLRVAGAWAMVTQPLPAAAPRIEVMRSRQLTGPWGSREPLYTGPITPGALTYNVSAHPEYGSRSVLISYSSMCTEDKPLLEVNEHMSPGFLRVRRSCLGW